MKKLNNIKSITTYHNTRQYNRKHTPITPIKYLLIALATTLFLLISCGVRVSVFPEDGNSPGDGSTLDYMSFTLTNRSGARVDTNTLLSRASRYGVTVRRENGAPLQTADYTFSVSPADAITVGVRRTNSIDFTVNNTSATSVTITAIHKRDNSIIGTLGLRFAPQSDFMSFALNNNVGTPINTTSFLNYSNTYILTTTPASGIAIRTANYDFSFSPANTITINTSTANTMTFTVNNTGATRLTIIATHKDNPVITKTLTLNLKNPDTAGLTPFANDIEGNTVPNLDGANALTREVLTPLGANAGATLVKRYATEAGAGNRDGSSWVNAWAATNLRNGINSIADASASKVYLVMIAGGTYKPVHGTSPSREISFSMKNRVAIMGGFEAEGGWARTGTTFMSGGIGSDSNGDNSYHVFNHVGLTLGNSHLYGVTITDGNANGIGIQAWAGGMYNSSSSPNLTLVTFRGNSAQGYGGGMYNSSSSAPVLNQVLLSENSANDGGGIYNDWSSPVISNTVFSGNRAISGMGGGIYNLSSSSVINNTVFSGNTAANDGGGIANLSSSPVFSQVVFSKNSANRGGGMVNNSSSPVINNTVFSGNTAANDGGGIYNLSSSPVMNNTVFSKNTAVNNGGGMFNWESAPVLVGTLFSGNSALIGGGMANNNNGQTGPHILNTIFFDNKANSGAEAGPDLAMNFYGNNAKNITIAGSVLGIGLANPTNGIVGYNGSGIMNINYHSTSLSKDAVNLTGTATFTVNGMDFTYRTIQAGSSAINLGLYIRKHVNSSITTYYYSETGATTSWYTGFTTAGGFDGSAVALPTTGTIEDMTARDIVGKARTERPDAGVNEL